LESTVAKLAQIFDVRQESSEKGPDGKKKTKVERMLTGSKTTKVMATGSVFNVSVVEKAPVFNKPKSQGSPVASHSTGAIGALQRGTYYYYSYIYILLPYLIISYL
jgi:hypothetical protein